MSLFFAVLPLIPPGPCLHTEAVGSRPDAVGSRVSENFPIRVHWQSADQEQKALLALDYADLAWQVQVEELGFRRRSSLIRRMGRSSIFTCVTLEAGRHGPLQMAP